MIQFLLRWLYRFRSGSLGRGRYGRLAVIGILIVVLIFILVTIDPPKVFFGVFLLYALSGPAMMLLRWKRKKTLTHDESPPEQT